MPVSSEEPLVKPAVPGTATKTGVLAKLLDQQEFDCDWWHCASADNTVGRQVECHQSGPCPEPGPLAGNPPLVADMETSPTLSLATPCVIYLPQRIMGLAIWLIKPDRLYLSIPRLNAENVLASL